ncbi:MAG: MarR family transcriptional regulator [Verrucomicrobia bacterium]|nr:MarR family transcriptional regulator [Verrucomicrobiota bacterium]
MDRIAALRQASRKLVRELGIIQLDKSLKGPTAEHCHAIVEIGQKPGITISELKELLLQSPSQATRLVQKLIQNGLVTVQESFDKREKSLVLTPTGVQELEAIDSFSKQKIEGAFDELNDSDQQEIVLAIQKYAEALEAARIKKWKIRTLSSSRTLRAQIVAMVEQIQRDDLHVAVTKELNASILRAEKEFYYNNSYNFWYAVDDKGQIIGCIGLKKLDEANGEVKKLFVDKRYRGKGVAESLMNTLLEAQEKHNFAHLWLGAVDAAKQAHRFYEKNNFVRVDKKSLPESFEKCPLDSCFYRRQ